MSTEFYCGHCKEWEPNIDLVNAPHRLMTARNPHYDYKGVYFRFCPWCGTRLLVRGAEPQSGDSNG